MSTTFKRFCKTLELINDAMLIETYKTVHIRGVLPGRRL